MRLYSGGETVSENQASEQRRFTIEEMSWETGVSTRNIRAFQSRGLLPSPEMLNRTGYYNNGHLARIRLITSLQERGYSLAGVGDLLKAWEKGRSLGDVLGFEGALTAGRKKEDRKHFTRTELEEMLSGPALTEEDIELARELRLFWPEGDGFHVPRPDLMMIGRGAVDAGLPRHAGFRELASILADTRKIAERFVTLYLDYFWHPFEERDTPADELPEMAKVLEELRRSALQLVYEATDISLEKAIEDKVAELFSEQAEAETETRA